MDAARKKRSAPNSGKGWGDQSEAAAQSRHETERARKAVRRGDRPGEDALAAAKQEWEQLRQREVDPAKRAELIDSILSRMMPTISELLLRHDASRVLQTVVKYATSAQRALVLEPVRAKLLDLAKSHYGRFLLLRLLKYSSKAERSRLIGALKGHVASLLRHAEAAPVVEAAYAHASTSERHALLKEMYGPEEALLGGTEPLAVRLAAHPERRVAIVKALRASLNTLAEKQLLGGAIAQHLLADLFTHATPEEAKDLVPSLAEQLLVLGATRDGARAAVGVVAYGSAKERKLMIKALKGHVCSVAVHPHAHPILLALLRWTDDTVLLRKSLLSELLSSTSSPSLGDVAADQSGLLCLLALLSPPSAATTPRDLLDLLTRYDAHAQSKKEPAARQAELRSECMPPLVALVAQQHASLLSSVRGASLVEHVLASMDASADEKRQLAQSIAASVLEARPTKAPDTATPMNDDGGDHADANADADADAAPLIECLAPSRALKRLAKNDVTMRQALADVLVARASHWAVRPGAGFVLLACLEAGDCKALLTALRSHASALAQRTEPAAKHIAQLLAATKTSSVASPRKGR